MHTCTIFLGYEGGGGEGGRERDANSTLDHSQVPWKVAEVMREGGGRERDANSTLDHSQVLWKVAEVMKPTLSILHQFTVLL